MTSYWNELPAGPENVRLLIPEGTWRAWADSEPAPGSADQERRGCRSAVTQSLQDALHSTNVIILLGSGASFCATNSAGSSAPSMKDLWVCVRAACETAEPGDFDAIVQALVGIAPGHDALGEPKTGNIERLLSLCKMRLELLVVMRDTLLRARATTDSPGPEERSAAAEIKKLSDFVSFAEGAILAKVGFVGPGTELLAHTDLLAKFARRSSEKNRVKLFTTNYDLCIEEAALRLNAILIDGFSHSARQRYNRDHFDHDMVRRRDGTARADYVDGVFQSL